MSINGENKEPIPFPVTGVGAQQQAGGAESPAQPLTPGDILISQAQLVQDLGLRVAHLLDATKDSFVRFLVESEAFYQMIRAIREVEEPSDNRPTDSPTTQATS